MATLFKDSRDIILVDYTKQGNTITGQYYTNLLDKKIATYEAGKVLIHHDNAPARSAAVPTSKLA